MGTKITVNPLSLNDVQKAIKKLTDYKENLDSKIDEFVKRLAEKGVDIAKEKVAVYTGELRESIDYRKNETEDTKKSYLIYTDCKYAVYVEFGTGVVGEDNPHPLSEEIGYEYKIGEKIYTTADGKTGWWYVDRFGVKRFTEGMESRPFMYETSEELTLMVTEIAKEVFGGANDDLSD